MEAGSDLTRQQPMTLVTPAPEYLPSYMAALERGWSPDNERGAAAALEELALIRSNPGKFLQGMVDLKAEAGPITLPDGSQAPRLPGLRQWMWDGEFCGSIGFRWQPGTESLPPHCMGHIGYAVVPWKRGRGLATQALAALLPLARQQELRYVELTTDPGNIPSQRTIETNGGVLVERFTKGEAYGAKPALRYRIVL